MAKEKGNSCGSSSCPGFQEGGRPAEVQLNAVTDPPSVIASAAIPKPDGDCFVEYTAPRNDRLYF